MKHLSLTVILFFLGLSNLISQNTVPFVAYWQVGDEYQFNISKIKQQWQENDELAINDTINYTATFEVLDSTETSYKIKWSMNVPLIQLTAIPSRLKQALSLSESANDELVVIYTTDELGVFEEIENWEKIAEKAEQALDAAEKELIDKEVIERKTLEKLMKQMTNVYTSKTGIETLAFQELLYFHFPFGLEYDKDEILEYIDVVPNVFGGKPINADAQLFIKEVDFEEDYAKLVQTRKVNPEDTQRLIEQLLKKFGLKNREMKKMMKTSVFIINDNNIYEYFYYPGIPIKIETTRRSEIDLADFKVKQITKVIIELID